jgi:hypothetical protein
VETPVSTTQKRTTPPRAWRGLEIAHRFPASHPDPLQSFIIPLPPPANARPAPPPPPPEEIEDEDSSADAAPPALRGDALARALASLK